MIPQTNTYSLELPGCFFFFKANAVFVSIQIHELLMLPAGCLRSELFYFFPFKRDALRCVGALAQPPWFNFPEWKKKKRIKCIFTLEVLQDADRSILLLVWRLQSEKKKAASPPVCTDMT